MPWAPELFSTPVLERLLEKYRRERLRSVPFFDGLVSGDDYSAIDFNVLVPGASGWFNGDFNHDGVVTGDDYSSIDFNILAQTGPL